MKLRLIFVLCLLTKILPAQSDSLLWEKIDKDVWFHFMQAYEDLDVGRLHHLHSSDFEFIIPENEKVLSKLAYLDKNLEIFNQWNTDGIDQRMSISFLSRTLEDSLAYESGIYRLSRNDGFGRITQIYVHFKATLCKVGDTWKMMTYSENKKNNANNEGIFRIGALIDY